MVSKFKISGEKGPALTVIEHEPPPVHNIQESTFDTNLPSITGRTKVIQLPGIKISLREGNLRPPVKIDVARDFPFLKIHIEIEGHSEYTPNDVDQHPILIGHGCYNFFYLPKTDGVLTYHTNNRRCLEINFSESFVKDTFREGLNVANADLDNAIKDQESYIMYRQSPPITPNLWLIINDIIGCEFQDEIKEVYLHSKACEVLSLLFSENSIKKKGQQNAVLCQKEYSQVKKAQQILNTRIDDPPTIEQLAMLLGINTSKLKTNFKIVFKTPIYKYVVNRRMEKAMMMLLQNEHTIAEIAYAVGYKNPQHFTTAFKKRYSCVPSALKDGRPFVDGTSINS